MRPSSPDPKQIAQERSGTLIETDEDIRRAQRAHAPGQPSSPAASRSTARPYQPTLRPPAASLTICGDGKSDGEVVRIRGKRFLIGPSEGDLLIPHDRGDDPFVEPRHIRLYRDANGAWHAQNNKSPNGLWLKVPQITVEDICLFQIGAQRFRLTAGG